jgi:glyoxylase-like metal-dependent hydrolase (beta-lactamase superfamily II)
MRVSVYKNPDIYSSVMYFVRGDWNKIDDVNTIIDPGTNGYIMNHIKDLSTGVGKKPVDQIIITHEHFDHAGALKYIYDLYKPKVYAFTKFHSYINMVMDGAKLQVGDTEAEIIHSPGHSNDSICIYVPESQALFTGDTPINIKTTNGTYIEAFISVLEKLSNLKIKTIYPGHDDPITENAEELIKESLKNVHNSRIIS